MNYNKKFRIGKTVKKLLFYFNKKSGLFPVIATTFISLVVIFAVVNAGSLIPAAPPGSSGFGLSDIYNRLMGKTDSQEADHLFAPAGEPGASMHSLQQIYETIPTIDPAKVFLGISYLGVTGTLTPDGGTAGLADLFNGQTAQLTGDWDLDTGTLNLACNTATFDGALNLVANTYDGGGNGTNRWCMTDSGDAAATDIRSGKVAWIDGWPIVGSAEIYVYGSDSPSDVLTSATAAGTYDVTNLLSSVVQQGIAWGSGLGLTGTLTPDGGTAGTSDVFSGKTAQLTNDWSLDAGTLNLACNISTFDGTLNLIANTYDGAGLGTNRWCITDSGDAGVSDVRSGKVAWIDGQAVTGTADIYVYGSNSADEVLTTATAAGSYDVSNLLNSVIRQGITWGADLGSTGTLTPDGGTAGLADLFNGQTAQLTGDWDLDTGTLNLACNTATFDGALNLVANTYDGGGNGTNRWCMTDSGDAAATDIRSGKVAWIDGQALTGTADIYVYGSDTASDVLTTATAGGTYDATNLNVGTVKSGTSFGVGLTGDYPSVTYPLPSASGTTDLAGDGSDITSSNGAVEWWTSEGTRQSATLDFPGLSNLCSTDTSNNAAGTLTITATAVGVGNTYCGTAGTLLANEFNGTTGIYTGGSQANGGGDDYNNGGAAPVDRYSKTWTACTAGNSYCGTSDSGADAKDDSTGLIWSLPCNGSGCLSFSDVTPLTYTWDNSGPNNNSLTASQLCSGHSGWFLPHQKQMMQAYIDGSYGNLEAIAVNRPYWSATTQASSPTGAWATYLSIGGTGTTAKSVNGGYVRCVR